MKFNKYKIVSVVFILFIFITGIGTAVFGAKQIGYNMLIGYKNNLPENATIVDKVRGIINGCESGMNTEYILEDEFVNIFGRFQKMLGKKVINDMDISKDVVKLNNGYLSFYGCKPLDVSRLIENTLEFNDFLDKQDTPFLYVQSPFKINKYDTQLPEGIIDYNNKKADDFLVGMEKAGVNTIDLRELMNTDNLDYYSMFFKTDHHWTPKAGLWAFGKISEKLNRDYAFNIDMNLADKDNYNIKTYEKWFLGTEGKRTGIYYTGIDDFDIITPKFDTEFDFTVNSRNIYRKGKFSETLIDWSNFGTKDYFNEWPYSTYSGGDVNYININNYKNKEGKKILLIKDSFSCVVIPFLATASSELDVVDIIQGEKIDLRKHIKESNPDIVIMMYNPSVMYKGTNAFDFE